MFIKVGVIFHKYVYVFTYVHRVCMIPLVISEVKAQKICEFLTMDCLRKCCTFMQIKCHSSYFRIGL